MLSGWIRACTRCTPKVSKQYASRGAGCFRHEPASPPCQRQDVANFQSTVLRFAMVVVDHADTSIGAPVGDCPSQEGVDLELFSRMLIQRSVSASVLHGGKFQYRMASGSPKQACRPSRSRRSKRLSGAVAWLKEQGARLSLSVSHAPPPPRRSLHRANNNCASPSSRATDGPAGGEHDETANHHLEGRTKELGVRMARPDPRPKLDPRGPRSRVQWRCGNCQSERNGSV